MHKIDLWGYVRLGLIMAIVWVAVAYHPLSHAAEQSGPPASTNTELQQKDSHAHAGQQSSQANPSQFHLSQERYQKAVRYSRAGYLLYFVSVAWGIVVLLLILKTRLAAQWRDVTEARSRHWIVQGLLFVPGLSLFLGITELPIRVYWHWLSLRYEQSVQGWPSWLWDWSKSQLVGVVFALVVALILFAVVRKAPQKWWLYFWFASIPLLLLLVLITPWVLDPMFHKFVPLEEQHAQLVESIEALSQRAGVPIPRERMFLMLASTKTNQINAYVTGIGASKRVVVWDNTIQKMTPDEVLFIVGHEMGHYVLGHVVKGIAFGLACIFVALWVAYHALQFALRRWGATWGLRGQDDWATLVALLLIASVLGFLGEPIGNGFSRRIEHAADVYGLEVVHGIVPNAQQTAAQSFQTMGELDLADPDPPRVITLWLYSHPPLADRLKFAHDYDPWDKGESPRYVK